MNNSHIRLVFILGLLHFSGIVFSQVSSINACGTDMLPLQEGNSVVTHFSHNFSGTDNDYVLSVVDISSPLENKIPKGNNWNAKRCQNQYWKKKYLGEVFGLCIDKRKDIFVTASSIYGFGVGQYADSKPEEFYFKNLFGSTQVYTGGEIYKINAATGVPTIFAKLPNALLPNTVLTNNTSKYYGLGNIAYDEDNDQYFVSNFYDGFIYRINNTGQIVSKLNVYNQVDLKYVPKEYVLPCAIDKPCDPVAKPDEKVWGLGVHNKTLYYSKWKEGSANIIAAISLSNSGDFIIPASESEVVTLALQAGYEIPVADIVFTDNDKMFLAQRTMGSMFSSSAHHSSIYYLEYNPVLQQYKAVPKSFPIGDYSYAIPYGANACGGIAYSPGENNLWATGDFLTSPDKVTKCTISGDDYIYGLVGLPSDGVPDSGPLVSCGSNVYESVQRNNSYFVDLNNSYGTQDKNYQGDVEIFSDCRLYAEMDACKNTTGITFSPKIQIRTGQVLSSLEWLLDGTSVIKSDKEIDYNYPGNNKNINITLKIQTKSTDPNNKSICSSVKSRQFGNTDEITPCTTKPPQSCKECIKSFSPIQKEKYIVTGWVKEKILTPGATAGYENAYVHVEFEGDPYKVDVFAKGPVIEGWQRLEGDFTVPENGSAIIMKLQNKGTQEAFFDDIRVHPFNSRMKSFVYDPVTQKLVAELDEENYATFYEYDDEGSLVRVKKETERGVMTIKETRMNQSKVELPVK